MYMIAASAVVANCDGRGGNALDSTVWGHGGKIHSMRDVQLWYMVGDASLIGPRGFWLLHASSLHLWGYFTIASHS